MPTWDEILKLAEEKTPQRLLMDYIELLSERTGRTTICYMSAFTVPRQGVPSLFFSIIDQDIQGFMTCSKGVSKQGLDLVLHTPGGDYEATKRIISYLHAEYKHIRVIVPHMAMSGGTLMACAADEILMGPYSSLGPTDPQTLIGTSYVPVDAIIAEFEKAFQEVSENPNKAVLWAERLRQIPFGRIEAAETMKRNSMDYLVSLLKTRNCKGKKDKKCKELADFINSHSGHSSHGRGISLAEATKRGLNVKDLRLDKNIEDASLSIFHAAMILFQQAPHVQKFVINNTGRRFITTHQGS